MTTASTEHEGPGPVTEPDDKQDQQPEKVSAKRSKRTDRPSTWEAMRGEHPYGELHPYWVHVISAPGMTMLGASLIALLATTAWAWVITFILLFFFGGVLGSALTSKVTGMLNTMGTASGMAWFVSTGALAALMSNADYWPTNPYVLAAWLVLAVAGAIVHRYIWGAVVESTHPDSPEAREERRKWGESVWATAFRTKKYGDVKIKDYQEDWAGVEVTVRLDPNREDTAASVRSNVQGIVRAAHNILIKDGFDGLGLGEGTVKATDQNDVIIIRVRTKDPLTETIKPNMPTEDNFVITDPDVPIHLGWWDNAAPIEVPVQGPHKVGVGTTGSGKSTWFIANMIGYARRPHWSQWAAGSSKLMDLIQPAIDAAKEVDGEPIIETWGGGDAGSKEEIQSAIQVVTAAYLLYLDRARRSNLPGGLKGRKGKTFVGTPDCPGIALYLDEVDDLVKRSNKLGPVKLPDGTEITVWDMLTTIGSKARAYGIELITATQRLTNSWFGHISVNDLLVNSNHRFLFRTTDGAATGDILKSAEEKAMGKKLTSMKFACMASIAGDVEPMRYGKTELFEDDHLVHITQLANRLGTLPHLKPEEMGGGVGDYYRYGDVNAGGTPPTVTTTAPSSSASTTGSSGHAGSVVGDHKKRLQERMDNVMKNHQPAETTGDDEVQDEPTEPNELDTGEEDANQTLEDLDEQLRQIQDLPEVSDEELERMREGHQPRFPSEPIELLGAILDAWDDLDEPPASMSSLQMVTEFGLQYLDLHPERRDSEDQINTNAAYALGKILHAKPIEVKSFRKSTGNHVSYRDLRASWEAVNGSDAGDGHESSSSDDE